MKSKPCLAAEPRKGNARDWQLAAFDTGMIQGIIGAGIVLFGINLCKPLRDAESGDDALEQGGEFPEDSFLSGELTDGFAESTTVLVKVQSL